MRGGNDHRENLSVRSRRGALVQGELEELQHLLEASPELRAAHQLGLDFDRIADVQPGDEERMARFVSAALKAKKPRLRSRTRARRLALLAAAAVLAACGVALAVRAVTSRHSPVPTPAPSATTKASKRSIDRGSPLDVRPTSPANADPASLPRPAKEPAPAPLKARDAETATPEPVAPTPGHSQSTAAFPAEPAAEPNAATLLRRANQERAIGDLNRTMALLEELERKFPNSPEAQVALVSLGKLLLLRGRANAALDSFSRYLARGGPLEAEALVGRAQALATLGRSSEERVTWETLLARFPGSVYAGQARERLAVLRAGATE